MADHNEQHHIPLGPIAGNSQHPAVNPLDPLSDANAKPVPAFAQESQQHHSLHARLMGQERSGKQNGTYVSPSDDIMSPASAKLNAFKEQRFAKSAKPRTLFARTTSINSTLNDDFGRSFDTRNDDVAKENEVKTDAS